MTKYEIDYDKTVAYLVMKKKLLIRRLIPRGTFAEKTNNKNRVTDFHHITLFSKKFTEIS